MTYFLLASWLWMQSANPAYFIETIEVVNRQAVSTDLIIAQTGLKAGGMIDEDQLRKAIRRIEQLPFVLSARFSLDKGSERGKYKLLIHIEESSKLFGDLQITRSYFKNDFDTFNSTNDSTTLGYRHFLGRASMLFGTYQPDALIDDTDFDGVFNIGYSNFDLLKTGTLLTVQVNFRPGETLRFRLDEEQFTTDQDDRWNLSVAAKVPLSRSQWLNLAYNHGDAGATFTTQSNEAPVSVTQRKETSQLAQIGWEFNTTNDALLPTSGLLLNADVVYGDQKNDVVAGVNTTSPPRENQWTFLNLQLSGEWYLNNREKHSWPIRLNLTYSETESDTLTNGILSESFDNESTVINLGAGYLYRLPIWLSGSPKGDLYAGADLLWSWNDAGTFFDGEDRQTFTTRNLTTAAYLAYRGKWGIARLTIRYSDTQDNLPAIQ